MQEDQRELEISGTLQQRLSSCFEVLNKFLRYRESPIVSSMVVAEKRGGAAAADNIVDAVISILGKIFFISCFLSLQLLYLKMFDETYSLRDICGFFLNHIM